MKKILWSVLVLSLLISTAAFAAETKKNEMPGMDTGAPMGMAMPGMGKMCCPMMGKAQMVATDEGGVIVLSGNKLIKYDADLNLVKEVEVPMPAPSMGGKQCPITGKMMDQGAAADAAGSQETAS